jgi:streptogramin lyase
VAVDGHSNVYAVNNTGKVIYKIDPSGVVNRFPITSLGDISGFAVSQLGDMYLTERASHSIRHINPSGAITTLAGTGVAGHLDGPSDTATFSSPAGLVLDGSGNLYVADVGNCLIRRVSPGGPVSTVAGALGQTDLIEGAPSLGIGCPSSLAISGRRLVFGAGRAVAQIDFMP